MSSSSPTPPSPPPPSSPAPSGQVDFDISEEYGTARKNMPPAGIVAICVAVVAIIAAVYALTHRAHALSSGTIDDVVVVPVPGQDMVMVAINISLENQEEQSTVIRAISATADIAGNKLTDEAAPAVDAQRYFQAFPALKQHALNLLMTAQNRINPGGKLSGTIVVSFPVTADAFAGRKSLSVIVAPYDEMPIVMTK
jgi:hypothetical protein